MDKLKRYIDCLVPIEGCTLRCHYCYITCHRKFNNDRATFKYTPEEIKRAFTKERLGGTCLINLCGGGETLLPEVMLQYIKVLLENGHYIMVVTNATLTSRFEEISKWPKELLERLIFKFSYHYLEFKQKGMLERFFSNVKLMRDRGASFTVEVTPCDELMPYVDECIDYCMKEIGAKPHCTIARDESRPDVLPILTKLPKDKYYQFWSSKFESSLFEFKWKIFEVPRKEFCYAGNWSGFFFLGSGLMTQCNVSQISQDIVKNPDEPIKFPTIGICQERHCYNGHSWLALGDIPDMETPTYAELRNRICADGTEWLQPKFKAFFSQKLKDENEQFNAIKKLCVTARSRWYTLRVKIGKIRRKIIG